MPHYDITLEARTTYVVRVEAGNVDDAADRAEEIANGEYHAVEDGAWRAAGFREVP